MSCKEEEKREGFESRVKVLKDLPLNLTVGISYVIIVVQISRIESRLLNGSDNIRDNEVIFPWWAVLIGWS